MGAWMVWMVVGRGVFRNAIIMVTSNQDLKSRPPMQRHESWEMNLKTSLESEKRTLQFLSNLKDGFWQFTKIHVGGSRLECWIGNGLSKIRSHGAGVFPNAVIMVTFSGSAPEWPNNSFIKTIHLGVKIITYGILTEKTLRLHQFLYIPLPCNFLKFQHF
jgi:hypothetical protein